MNLIHSRNSERSLASWAGVQTGIPGFTTCCNPQGKLDVEQRAPTVLLLCFHFYFSQSSWTGAAGVAGTGWNLWGGRNPDSKEGRGDFPIRWCSLLGFTPCQKSRTSSRGQEFKKHSKKHSSVSLGGLAAWTPWWLQQTPVQREWPGTQAWNVLNGSSGLTENLLGHSLPWSERCRTHRLSLINQPWVQLSSLYSRSPSAPQLPMTEEEVWVEAACSQQWANFPFLSVNFGKLMYFPRIQFAVMFMQSIQQSNR